MGRLAGFSSILCVVALLAQRAARIPSRPAAYSPKYLTRLDDLRKETAHVDETLHRHTFLVIGGTGFTGRNLVEDLLARGVAPRAVRVLSRKVPPASDRLAGVQYLKGSITDAESLRRALAPLGAAGVNDSSEAGVSVVFHTAAHYGSPPMGRLGEGKSTEMVNVGGMRNVLNASRASGTVRYVLFCSTVETIFDATTTMDATEERPYAKSYRHNVAQNNDVEGLSLSHYSRTKIAAEKLLLAADDGGSGSGGDVSTDNNDNTPSQSPHRLRTVALRPAGIYGPKENYFIPKAVAPAYVLRLMPLYFDRSQLQDWTFVYNLVWAHMAALHALDTSSSSAAAPDAVGGKAFHITDGSLVNAAAWGIFEPIVRAVGGVVAHAIPFPAVALRFCATQMEAAVHALWPGSAPPLTLMEALKATTSTSHSIASASAAFGYRPLFSTHEGQQWTAEEFGRRFGVDAHAQPRALARAARARAAEMLGLELSVQAVEVALVYFLAALACFAAFRL
eukprot:g1813.t1